MRCALVAYCLAALVLSLLAVTTVTADYSVCSGSNNECLNTDTGFCCPTTTFGNLGNDAASSTCAGQPNCATPAYVAVWSNPTCAGTSINTAASWQSIEMSSSGASTCQGASFGSGVYWTLVCGASSSSLWKLSMWSSASACSAGSSPLLGFVESSSALDTSCYSTYGGYSVTVVCPAVVASSGDVGGPLVVSNGFHTAENPASAYSSFSGDLSFGTWRDSACSYGTATMSPATAGSCKTVTQNGANQASYEITCSGSASTSSWTASQWVGSSCSGSALGSISGQGQTCAALPSGASIMVDCTKLLQNLPVNYLAPVDGYLTDWSACSATACGTQGTETRSCVPPQYGGAACPSASLSQTCDASSCSGNGGNSGSGDSGGDGEGTSSTSTGSQSTPSSGPSTSTASSGSSTSSTYAASVAFLLTFSTGSSNTSQASFISTVQSNVATMAGVSTQQVQVTVPSASGRRLLGASSQLQVTLLASSTSVAQAAYSQFQTAFSSTDPTTNPLLAQNVDTSSALVSVSSVTCADGSTAASTSDCSGVTSAAATPSAAFGLAAVAVASVSLLLFA